jgi:mono/diheme cytochrome c family protein
LNLHKAVTLALFLLCTYTISAEGFDAKQQFQQKCAMCHGADGKHVSTIGKNLGSPDLSSDKVRKMSDKELHETIENGRGKMPAYGKSLGDKNVDVMVKYIRSIK